MRSLGHHSECVFTSFFLIYRQSSKGNNTTIYKQSFTMIYLNIDLQPMPTPGDNNIEELARSVEGGDPNHIVGMMPQRRRARQVPTNVFSSKNLLIVFIQLVILLGVDVGETHGQENPRQIGVDLCACSPRTFEFTFQFNLTCPPVNITEGEGVQSTSCLLSPFSDPDTTDLVPVAIQSIDIVELGQDVSVLVRESITGNFLDGDSFSYESIINTPEEVAGANDIPRVLQMNIVGVNIVGEEIINVFIITYSNACDQYPVLFERNSIGWTRMVRIYIQNDAQCCLSTATSFLTREMPVNCLCDCRQF